MFLRLRDSATVVYKVAVKDGKVYHGESSQEEPDEQRWLVKPKAYGSRSRPSLHLERVAGERTVFRLERGINGRDWRFQARRLETGALPMVLRTPVECCVFTSRGRASRTGDQETSHRFYPWKGLRSRCQQRIAEAPTPRHRIGPARRRTPSPVTCRSPSFETSWVLSFGPTGYYNATVGCPR